MHAYASVHDLTGRARSCMAESLQMKTFFTSITSRAISPEGAELPRELALPVLRGCLARSGREQREEDQPTQLYCAARLMLAHRADNSLDATLASDSLPAFVSSEAADPRPILKWLRFMHGVHAARSFSSRNWEIDQGRATRSGCCI
jgi:hypothetical protein